MCKYKKVNIWKGILQEFLKIDVEEKKNEGKKSFVYKIIKANFIKKLSACEHVYVWVCIHASIWISVYLHLR